MLKFLKFRKKTVHTSDTEMVTRLATARQIEIAQQEFEEGNRALAMGQSSNAERHFRNAVAKHPRFAEAHCNLGGVLRELRQPEASEKHLRSALLLNPKLSPGLFNLAMLCIDQYKWEEAAELLMRYLLLAGNHAQAQYWLGNCEMGMGNQRVAQKAYAKALKLDSRHLQARWGETMAKLPAIAETPSEHHAAPEVFFNALKKLQRWIEQYAADTAFVAVGAQQPFYLAYIEHNHRQTLQLYGELCTSLLAKWKFDAHLTHPPHTMRRTCRVGIVSAHVHSHSVWHAMLKGWVAHLNPEQFEIHLFHTGKVQDDQTQWASRRLKRLYFAKGAWTDWAKLITDMGMDVLIYPEIGMDSTTVRLSSLRLAPIQLAAWGHPITSGLPTIDAYLSAQAFEPTQAQTHYAEKLIQLPRLGCYYEPFDTKPSSVDLEMWGLNVDDKILLCAGVPSKYAPQHDVVWAEIAKRCESSKLVFFVPQQKHASLRFERRLREAFRTANVDFDASVRFVPWQSQDAFFGWLDAAYLYLDTIGFSGFNTVMQAMERATPVVAYDGKFMRGRFASGVLRQLGLVAWIADTPERYIQLVVDMCDQPALRQSIQIEIKQKSGSLYRDKDSVVALGAHLLELRATAHPLL